MRTHSETHSPDPNLTSAHDVELVTERASDSNLVNRSPAAESHTVDISCDAEVDPVDPVLREIADAWSALPPSLQDAMLAIARTADAAEPQEPGPSPYATVYENLWDVKPVELSRQELYELVWTMPAVKLSEEFGVSDVAIGKAYRRHRVPRPKAGHWVKLRLGKATSRPPLGKASRPELETVRFYPQRNSDGLPDVISRGHRANE